MFIEPILELNQMAHIKRDSSDQPFFGSCKLIKELKQQTSHRKILILGFHHFSLNEGHMTEDLKLTPFMQVVKNETFPEQS